MARLWHAIIYTLLGLIFSTPAVAQEVDLELVLAMDGSGSISETEFQLQMIGTAAAFRDPAVQQAILSGPTGRVAVATVIWADAAFQKPATLWYLLDSPQSIDRYAVLLLSFYQHSGRKFGIGGGGTGIGDGIVFALRMIDENSYDGLRRVVDVSGDGIETDPWFRRAFKLPAARDMARDQNVTINGLAILTDFPRLDEYYRENVIFGPGSFVIRAQNFDDFAEAIQEKLLREISSPISRNDRGIGLELMQNPS